MAAKNTTADLNVVVDQLRDKVVALIELIRAVPAERRTPAMQRMLEELIRAVDRYDQGKVG
jgi:hypothetical protein